MLGEKLKSIGLSQRETEVAKLVSQGLSNKDVANHLFVTEKTIKFHLTNVYRKMKVKSRAQLVVWCAPLLSFEEKIGWSAAPKPQEPIQYTIPVGISKIGNA